MDKKQATKWLYKIYQQLFRPYLQVRFKRLSGLSGELSRRDDGTIEMAIDPYDPFPMVSTIIHEGIHLCDSNLDEKEVLDLENKIFNAISTKQMENLMKKIVYLM